MENKDEKRIEDMTPAELRAALDEFTKSQQPAPPAAPDAPGCEGLPEKSRATASELYGQMLLRKDAGSLTAAERDWLRTGIAHVLKHGW